MANKEWTKPMQWDNTGVAPSDTLIANGFKGGDKPPAGVFNYFLHQEQTCIEELQTEVDNTNTNVENLQRQVDEHDHDEIYYQIDNVNALLSGKSDTGHTHTIADVSALQTVLNGKSETNHTHPYAGAVVAGGAAIAVQAGTATDSVYRNVWFSDNNDVNKMVQNDNFQYNPATGTLKVANIAGNCATATEATEATKATQDSNGNNIVNTYATKSSIPTNTSDLTNDSDFVTSSELVGRISDGSYAEVFNDYENNSASGNYAHAEGFETSADGECSHAEGSETTASGTATHAEGYLTQATGLFSHAGGYSTISQSYQTVIGKCNTRSDAPTAATDTTGSLFVIGNGDNSTSSNAFRVTTAGGVYGQSSYKGSGADYAEMWEWQDGNTDDEDRRGYFVTVDENNKICIATPDDYILGVISATPVVVGDIQSEIWHDTYLKDVFGENLTKIVEVEETTDKKGNIIPAHTETRYILNPDYDPTKKYISRDERKEWEAVGLMGKLVVIDDGTCAPGSYCRVADNGTATATEDKNGWRVLRRLDETHVQILFR